MMLLCVSSLTIYEGIGKQFFCITNHQAALKLKLDSTHAFDMPQT